jgi:hypothetical protein
VVGEQTADEMVNTALKVASRVATDPGLRTRLLDDRKRAEVIKELRLPLSSEGTLLQLVNRMERVTKDSEADFKRAPDIDARIRDILLKSFDHIDQSFLASLVMSIVLFVVGLLLLGVAVVRSLVERDVSTSTLTIAGLAIADFVLLFYSRPWQDIQANLTNSQQVKIIATSYLSSVSLLEPDQDGQLKSLAELTRDSVDLLRECGSGSRAKPLHTNGLPTLSANDAARRPAPSPGVGVDEGMPGDVRASRGDPTAPDPGHDATPTDPPSNAGVHPGPQARAAGAGMGTAGGITPQVAVISPNAGGRHKRKSWGLFALFR